MDEYGWMKMEEEGWKKMEKMDEEENKGKNDITT